MGHECRSVDAVEATPKVDNGIAEQPAKQLDLLYLPGAPGTKVLPKSLVLNGAPADAHAEAQPATGQQGNVGSLPGYQRRLPLREDQDSGGKPYPSVIPAR